MSHFTIRVLRSCPELGLQPADLITFEPEIGSPDEQLFVHRPLAENPGSLLLLLGSGGAELLTPHSTVADFAAALGRTTPPPIPAGPIDMGAALAALRGRAPGAPREPGVFESLSAEDYRRHMAKLRRVRRKRPKTCRSCGAEFIPTQEHQVSCPECKATRQRRCVRCDRLFNAKHARQKSCESCLERRGGG